MCVLRVRCLCVVYMCVCFRVCLCECVLESVCVLERVCVYLYCVLKLADGVFVVCVEILALLSPHLLSLFQLITHSLQRC